MNIRFPDMPKLTDAEIEDLRRQANGWFQVSGQNVHRLLDEIERTRKPAPARPPTNLVRFGEWIEETFGDQVDEGTLRQRVAALADEYDSLARAAFADVQGATTPEQRAEWYVNARHAEEVRNLLREALAPTTPTPPTTARREDER